MDVVREWYLLVFCFKLLLIICMIFYLVMNGKNNYIKFF